MLPKYSETKANQPLASYLDTVRTDEGPLFQLYWSAEDGLSVVYTLLFVLPDIKDKYNYI